MTSLSHQYDILIAIVTNIYDVMGIEAWHTADALICQFFNDITYWNSFYRIFKFCQQITILKSFNSVLIMSWVMSYSKMASNNYVFNVSMQEHGICTSLIP